LTCDDGYQLAKDSDVCVEQKESCASYNSSGECLACDEGYQLAEDTDVCVEQ